MTNLCQAAEFIVDNAENGRTNRLVCKDVLNYAWAISHTIDQNWDKQKNSYLYEAYIGGDEELPEYTQWSVSWLFEQTIFPNELPRSWNGNPILDREMFLPDMMLGLKKAAEKFIKDQCGEES